KKDSGQRCRDELVDDERNTHSIGADACGHEFGESEPDTDAGPDGEGSHEEIETEGDEPPVARGWHGSDDSALDFERRGPRGFEVTEWIFKEGFDGGVGNAAFACDLDRSSAGVV